MDFSLVRPRYGVWISRRSLVELYWVGSAHERSGVWIGPKATLLVGRLSIVFFAFFLLSGDSLGSSEQRAFQQGSVPCNERNCQYGGQCTLDPNGLSRCECRIYCSREKDPICGTDGVTYKNPCQMRAARCQKQMDITRLHFGQCGR